MWLRARASLQDWLFTDGVRWEYTVTEDTGHQHTIITDLTSSPSLSPGAWQNKFLSGDLRDLRDAGKLRLTWLHFMSWGSVSQTLGTAAFVLELRHIFHTLLIFFIINNWILSVLVKTSQREIEEWSWWKQKAEVYYFCFRFFSPFSLIHLSKYKHKAS